MPRSSRGHRLGRALVDAAVVCPEGRPEAAGDAGGLCAVRVVKEEDVVDRRNLPRDSRDLAEIDVGKGRVARSSRELAEIWPRCSTSAASTTLKPGRAAQELDSLTGR